MIFPSVFDEASVTEVGRSHEVKRSAGYIPDVQENQRSKTIPHAKQCLMIKFVRLKILEFVN